MCSLDSGGDIRSFTIFSSKYTNLQFKCVNLRVVDEGLNL